MRSTEGTWNGSSITSKTRDQLWTLDHVGNWDHAQLDLDGDGSFTGTDEYDDARTHNAVNELTARDTDDDGTDDFTLTYDAVGNLTDDGENYKYEWDAFGRMRKVKNRSTSALVAEYRYNGLGHMIAVHEDTDRDGDVDGDDVWFYRAYDERWREIASFREDDTDPKEEFVPHQAGRDGYGGSSYINGVVLRDKDADTDWTEASDGVLEERVYYCQNWRGDVSALITSGREMLEWVKYLSYGVPFGLPAGDADSDGDCDNTDIAQIQSWANTQTYDVRGDIDLDGDVDGTDVSLVQSSTLGFAALSGVDNRGGYAGYRWLTSTNSWAARHRVLSPSIGQWLSRDPLMYAAGLSLYEYGNSSPLVNVDPLGLLSCPDAKTGIGTVPSSLCHTAPGFLSKFHCLQAIKDYVDKNWFAYERCPLKCSGDPPKPCIETFNHTDPFGPDGPCKFVPPKNQKIWCGTDDLVISATKKCDCETIDTTPPTPPYPGDTPPPGPTTPTSNPDGPVTGGPDGPRTPGPSVPPSGPAKPTTPMSPCVKFIGGKWIYDCGEEESAGTSTSRGEA